MNAQPPQPTLRDGDVVLRPWSMADVDPARLGHDEEIRRWFGFPVVTPSHEQQAAAVRDWQEKYAAGRRAVSFVVERDGEIAGTVEVRREDSAAAHLSWALFAGHRGRGTMTRALRLLITYAFVDLGVQRVFAYVDPRNVRSLRVASRSGLRREGLVRGREVRDGVRRDDVLLGRLRDDPEPTSRHGFIAMLNANLATKRIIAHGVARDEHGRVLLAELTYKAEWDLPGGVVEPGESPRTGLAREVMEEIGLDLPIGGLLTVNWLSPWCGWDDACTFVFDLGTYTSDLTDATVLQPTEIGALHWCDEQQVTDHAAAATRELLAFLRDNPGGPCYLEGGHEPVVP